MASPTNVKIPKVTQYVRNVGKSVAFASINAIGNQMPGVKGFIEDNDEVFRDVYHSVKNYKDTIRNVNKSIHNSNLYKAVEFGTKNMIEDAKSGNFYNKSRSTENAESILGLEDDMDFDYEINDESSNVYGNKYLANSFDEAIGAAAIGTTTAVARGTDIIVRSNKASTTMISSQIEKSTATLHSGIGAVYNSINVVNTFLAGPMTAHLENSKKYYENSLKIMQEQHAMVREMLEMQRNLYKAQDRVRGVSKIDKVMDYNGMPDLKAYKEIVKGNIDDVLNAFHLGKNSGFNLPMMIAAAPFMLLFEGLAESSMPKSLKRNFENLDSSFMSIFPNLIARLSNGDFDLDIKKKRRSIYEKAGGKILNTREKEDNDDIDSLEKALKSVIGSIFGIKIEKKNSINTSNYVKGAVPFDGITRKTIVEVIPGYLARIEAALTGSRERHYDPHKGIWRSIDEIDESFKSEKAKAIQMGNRDIIKDIYGYRSRLDPNARKSFDKSIQKMLTRIFDDSGSFDPGLITEMNPEYTKDGKRIRRVSSSADYKKYGFKSREEFEVVLSQLSNKTIQNIAINNLRARQNYSRKLEQQEIDGGVYNLLFNGAYDPTGKGSTKKMNAAGFASRNPLAAMTDTHGKNVFYYLREILNGINNRWRSREKSSIGGNYSYTTTSEGYSTSREYSTASESEGDSGSDSDDDDDDTSAWRRAEESINKETKKKREEKEKKEKILKFTSEKFNNSPVGKFFNKAIGNLGDIFAKPVEFANDLLEKANENIFALMFGNKELKDEKGQPIDNILEYMINKVKTSFDELGKWIKNKFRGYFSNIWEKVKNHQITNEVISIGRAAKARVGTAFKRTFDHAVNAILDRLPANVRAKLIRGEVVTQEEIVKATRSIDSDGNDYADMDAYMQDSAERVAEKKRKEQEAWDREYDSFQDEDEGFYDNIIESARGRVAKKRGLTMISPGEIIIPASFNKKEQNKMLSMEKRDRYKILNAIGLNAKGNVDTEEIKRNLNNIYEENKGTNKSSKTIASSIVGGGAGLLLGHPLIGAIAGAGISILNNSDTLKKIVFGEDIDGEHREGLISKKIQDKFKTVLPDMGDYGIVGGVLGLLTPFGPLGGAAIGAGIGYLKHSEGFHKFIFGDESTGEEGLISEEAYKKFKEHVKKAAPNMLLGTVGGILAGPFGLLGNAALGASVGLLSSTEGFHKFIFGDDPEEGKGGVLDAFKTGFLDPAKDKFIEFLADFKKFARRNIIDPMKDFWKPFNQAIKNTVKGVGERVGDFLNDMFEKTLGLPLHDFLQEKIFKPVGKIVFGMLKAPYTLAKGVVAAPFRALGGIGNTIRANQIRKGTAYDMSASERLAWRDQHWLRFNRFNRWNDKNYFQDNMMANMTDEQLEELSTQANAGLHSYATLQKQTGSAKKAVGEQISGFFNTKTTDGKNRFNRVKYNKVNDLTEIAQSGNLTLTNKYIDSIEELTDDEKEELKRRIREKVREANSANKSMNYAKKGTKALDKEISEIIGQKFGGRTSRRRLYKNAEAELAARRTSKVAESPEVNATNVFAEIYKKKADTIIACFKTANEYLDNLVNPTKKDTRPPGDQEAAKKTESEDAVSKRSKENDDIIKEASKTIEDKNKKKKKSGKFWNGMIGDVVVDEDSKEATDLRKKEQAQEEEEAKNLKANEDQVSILSVIKEAIVGKDRQPKEETGFFGKVLKGLGKFGKFIGLTGLALTGVSLFGHATHWFKTSVWPDLKYLLFGSDDDKTDGLVGKLTNGIKTYVVGEDGNSGIYGSLKKLLYGENGNDGVLAKFGNFITEGINKITNWFTDKGGLQGLLINHVIPGFINGLSYAINYVVTPASVLIFKALPSLLTSLGKALLEGMKIAFLNDDVPNGSRYNLNSSNTSSALENVINTTGSSIESNDKTGVVANIKGAFSNLGSAILSTDTTIDLSSIFSKDGGKNNRKSDGLLGWLGQTTRTNEVEYDENGNPITDYVQWNKTDSIASRTAKASGRALWTGLIGGINKGAKTISGTGTGMVKSISNLTKPGVLNKVKGITGITTNAGKAALNTVSTAANTGNAINKAIDAAGEYKGKYLASTKTANYVGKYADDVAKVVIDKTADAASDASKKGIIAGIKRIFKGIGDSPICSTIARHARNFTNKEVTEKVVKEAIEKIGNKISDTLLGKLTKSTLKTVGNIIARYSILQWVTFITDFLWGFDNAHTILGVAIDSEYNVTLAHKCACGLTNLLVKKYTFGLLTADDISDIVFKVLFNVFEFNDDALRYARDVEADALMKAHNAENIDNPEAQVDNLQDYNNKDKWWYKTSKKFSATYTDVKTAVSAGVESVKEGLNHVGDNVSAWFTNFVNGAKTLAPLVGSALIKHIQKAWNFDNNITIDDSIQTTGDESLDKIGNVVYGIGKYMIWHVTALGNGIKFVKNGIETIISAAGNVSKVVSSGINDTMNRAKAGSLSGITNGLQQSTGNKLLDLVANGVYGISKVFTTPIALLVSGFANIKSAFSNIVSKWAIAKSTKASDDSKITRATNGSLSVFSTTYWKNADHSNQGIMGAIVNVQTYLEKIINAPIAIIKNVINTVTNSLNSVKSIFGSGKLKSIFDWFTGFFTDKNDEKTNTKSNTKTSSGRGRKFGKAHIYQSGVVADIPYGDSTIGDAGCAPVAATNLLNSLGIRSSLRDAAKFAEANGMTVRGGGTDIDYFNHYLRANGIATKNTNSRNDVMNALRHGDQVIMLGRDSVDGYGTPFGTDPHFVTAKGISKSGNIIAEDPDLPDKYVEYKPGKMMNSMISSVIADTGMGRNRKRFGRGKYGLGAAEVAMLDEYTITSTFDEPRSNSSGRHGALDLVKYNNAPIYAFTNGTVKYTESRYAPDSGVYGSSDGGGFGNYVTLVDDNGYYHTYAHMNGVYVSPGDIINRGDQLGIQGHTGSSTGSHLHYQIAKGSVSGTKQNPKTYLQNYDSSSNDNSAYWDNEDSYYDDDNYYYDDSSSSNDSSHSDSSSSSSSSEYTTTSTKPTLFSALTNLGKSVARYLYGDAYNTIHGFSDTNTSISYNNSSSTNNSSSSSNNDSYYDDEDYYNDTSGSDTSYPSDSSSSSDSTPNHTGTINKTYITSLMWKKFREEFGLTEAGAAGMMGNINAESAFKANNLQDAFNTKFGITDEQYTDQVNKKSRSKNSFINDGAGYGYAQWTWGPRKEGLYNMSVENGVDIGAPYIQMDYINKELTSNYNDTGNILRSTNNVNTASDRVLRSYEAPADPESKIQNRRNYSWAVYNTYKGTGRSDSNLYKYKTGSAAKTLNDMSRTANVINNNYYGSARDTVDYATFLKTIVEILVTISNNTSMLNKIVEILSSKFDITIDPNEVKSAATNANTRAQAERKINQMIEDNNNLSTKARILNNKDTSYLLSAMTAIAAE